MSAARKSSAAGPASGFDLVITRTFDAPRELVFRMWTDPNLMAQWWGPHGFTNAVCEIDARPGGLFRIDMRAPDGTIYPGPGAFREVKPPERLVFTSGLADGAGNVRFEVLNTVTFAAQGKKTKLTLEARVLHIADPDSAWHLGGMETGWTQSLERLDTHISQLQRLERSHGHEQDP